jgi:beta-N-acetylhexosaminidase
MNKPFYLTEKEEAWVKQTLESLTVEEKIGQLFVLLGDAYPWEELQQLVQERNIGGVLFRPGARAAVKEKFDTVADLAKVPLLRCANLEEGGAGVLSDGTYFGSQMEVAAANKTEITESFAANCALEGKSVGVNWNFAPVVDIDKNFRNPITNVRTYGSDVEKVKANAVTYVKALQARGMAAAAKHFPGDGVDYRDQHLHPTYNDLPAEEWYASYGAIYQALIQEGLMSVMVGHIVQPNVIRDINPQATEEDLLPASMSREMLTGVLREKFGFEGVIITDATIMGGYTMPKARKEAIPATIAAGCDMICFTPDIYEDLDWVKEALSDGRLTEQRLDEAVQRILSMKAALQRSAATEAVSETDAYEDGKAWAKTCADAAITLVKNKGNLVPVSSKTHPRVRLMLAGEDAMYDGSAKEIAKAKLEEMGFDVEMYDPFADDLHGSRGLDKSRLSVLLLNYPTASNNVTVRPAWCPKHALEIPRFIHEEDTVVISLNNPYHLQDVPRVRAYINTYTATRVNLELALEKMCGQGTFQGTSPVDAFCGLYDTRL